MKPCPFCEGEPAVCRSLGVWYVACAGGEIDPHCNTQGPTGVSREDAIAKWNRRR